MSLLVLSWWSLFHQIIYAANWLLSFSILFGLYQITYLLLLEATISLTLSLNGFSHKILIWFIIFYDCKVEILGKEKKLFVAYEDINLLVYNGSNWWLMCHWNSLKEFRCWSQTALWMSSVCYIAEVVGQENCWFLKVS